MRPAYPYCIKGYSKITKIYLVLYGIRYLFEKINKIIIFSAYFKAQLTMMKGSYKHCQLASYPVAPASPPVLGFF